MDSYSQDLFNIGVDYLLPSFISQLLYPARGQEEISVLLLTDQSVDRIFSGKWPIGYDAHGRILKALSRYNPKAIVIDFLWLNSQKSGADYVFRNLQRLKQKKIPVYLTVGDPNEWAASWPELQGLVIPVSPHITMDPTDFVARNYAISPEGLPRPAVKVYRDLYDSKFSPPGAPDMQIFWGVNENPWNSAWMDEGDRPDNMWHIMTKGLSLKYTPPYTTTVLVRDLLNPTAENEEMAHEDLTNHLAGKVVFYGAQVTGSTDIIYTPRRQLQAGVYYHSMALDNLITLNGNYKSDKIKNEFKDRWNIDDIALHVIILLVPSLIICFRHSIKKNALARAKKEDAPAGFPGDRPPTESMVPTTSRLPPFLAKAVHALGEKAKSNWRSSKNSALKLKSAAKEWILYRTLLYGWIIACATVCFFALELAPRHWVGYILFAELSFYIDTILRLENAKTLLEKDSNA